LGVRVTDSHWKQYIMHHEHNIDIVDFKCLSLNITDLSIWFSNSLKIYSPLASIYCTNFSHHSVLNFSQWCTSFVSFPVIHSFYYNPYQNRDQELRPWDIKMFPETSQQKMSVIKYLSLLRSLNCKHQKLKWFNIGENRKCIGNLPE
jgi:hypothetical protein